MPEDMNMVMALRGKIEDLNEEIRLLSHLLGCSEEIIRDYRELCNDLRKQVENEKQRNH